MGTVVGPWRCAFTAELPFALMSKSNFRRGGRTASASWSSLSGFEKSVGLVVAAARPSSWEVSSAGVALPQRPITVSVVVAASLLDVGNFHKSLLDACEGVLFVSDAEVRAAVAVGERSRAGQRALLGFAQLEHSSSLAEIAHAASVLTQTCVDAFGAAAAASS